MTIFFSNQQLTASGPPAGLLEGLNSPLIQEEGTSGEKSLKLRFDVSQYAPEEIVLKTIDNKLLVSVTVAMATVAMTTTTKIPFHRSTRNTKKNRKRSPSTASTTANFCSHPASTRNSSGRRCPKMASWPSRPRCHSNWPAGNKSRSSINPVVKQIFEIVSLVTNFESLTKSHIINL